ncbi:MAG: tetratricopeptide repeat protein [Actinomycetes bacterium]
MDLHRLLDDDSEGRHGTVSGAHVAELAHHFAQAAAAGDAAKALAYAREAGERAMGLHAYEEADAHYRRALEALRFAGPDDPGRCRLLLRLGAAQARAGRYREAEMSCLEAAELARKLGSSELLAQAALGYGQRELRGGEVNRRLVELLREALEALPATDGPLRARLLARLSLELTFSDETEPAGPVSREAVELARRLGDTDSLSGALRARWMTVWGPDGLEECSAIAEELLRLGRAAGDRELELAGRCRRATSSLQSGDARTVAADISACAGLAEELRMPAHQWLATTMRAMWRCCGAPWRRRSGWPSWPARSSRTARTPAPPTTASSTCSAGTRVGPSPTTPNRGRCRPGSTSWPGDLATAAGYPRWLWPRWRRCGSRRRRPATACTGRCCRTGPRSSSGPCPTRSSAWGRRRSTWACWRP